MGQISQSGNLQAYANGLPVQAPVDWEEIRVLATFENTATQANLTVSEVTLVGDARRAFLQHIADGNMFEGFPYNLVLSNTDSQVSIFDGFIDPTQDFVDNSDLQRAICTLVKANGLNSFDERLSAVTFGHLVDIGLITSADYIDVDYVVEKPINAFELFMTAMMAYLMAKELAENIKDIAEAIGTIAGILVAGITGSVGAAILAIATAILQIIYAAAILAAIIKLARDLVSTFVPPKRTHKAMTFKKLLEKACAHLGYSFNSSITMLDKLVFLASNQNVDQSAKFGFIERAGTITEGIPNANDFGYVCSEMFETVLNMFYARVAIVGSTVQLHPVASGFWQKISDLQTPDVLLEEKRYNPQDLKANILVAFDTDIRDDWTIQNFKGTNYEIITDLVTVADPRAKYIKGLEEIRIGACLGNRKDQLNAFEEALKSLGTLVDKVTGVFGKGTNIASQIKGKVGVLKVTDNNHSKPKILYMEGGRIPKNHRDLLSAKLLWQQFIKEKSFINSIYEGQKAVYSGVEIPFGLRDFLKTIDNSYFQLADGRTGKFTSIEWGFSRDKATVDFWVQEKYTNNLKETYIEA